MYKNFKYFTFYFQFLILVPEDQWDVIADFIKSTSEQMEDYYDQLEKEKPQPDEGKLNDGEVNRQLH